MTGSLRIGPMQLRVACVLFVTAVIVYQTASDTQARQSATPQPSLNKAVVDLPRDVLKEDLKHHRAWVMLGVVSNADLWLIQPGFVIKNSAAVAPLSHADHVAIPTVGQFIEFTAPHDLFIVGYGKTRDESRAFEIPGTTGRLEDGDRTNLVIQPTIVVRIDAVVKGVPEPEHGKSMIWARVVPR